jgi:hypothetical protein
LLPAARPVQADRVQVIDPPLQTDAVLDVEPAPTVKHGVRYGKPAGLPALGLLELIARRAAIAGAVLEVGPQIEAGFEPPALALLWALSQRLAHSPDRL